MNTLQILEKLVKIPSHSGQEKDLHLCIQKLLKTNGVESKIINDNLIAKIKGKDPKKTFVFSGHSDIVDVGDKKKWTFDAFSAKIIGGKIYGRGTSDMKSGLAAIISTCINLSQNKNLPTNIYFAFVTHEETNGTGSINFLNYLKKTGVIHNSKNISAIITEPTNLNSIQIGHRGNFFLEAKSYGDVGHSARPGQIKRNANKEMIAFISELEKLNITWQKQFIKNDFPTPTITLTSIEGLSTSPNKVADNCTVALDLRTTPKFHSEALEYIKQIASKRKIEISIKYAPFPPGYTDPNAKIVKAAKTILPKAGLLINDASNDLGAFTTYGIETIVFGPGERQTSHTTNEYALVKNVEAAPLILEQIYFAWAND